MLNSTLSDDEIIIYEENESDRYDTDHFDDISDHEGMHDDLVIQEVWYA